jgi:hypothetical protein
MCYVLFYNKNQKADSFLREGGSPCDIDVYASLMRQREVIPGSIQENDCMY